MHINYWREVKGNFFGRTGLGIIIMITFFAVAGPYISRYSPQDYTGSIFSPPTMQYWLGTDNVGRDIFSTLSHGARTSIAVGCGSAVAAAILSVLLGGIAGLAGGLCDRLLMRLVDTILILPPVVVAILVAAYAKPGPILMAVLLAFFLWPAGARIIRAQVLSLKKRAHVDAARTFGAGRLYLLAKHIVPETGPVLAAILIQDARRAVFMEAGLSFLGVSDPTVASLGKMIQQALVFAYLDVWKWWLLPAGLTLSFIITGLVFAGCALETALNPRLREGTTNAGN